MSHHFIGHLFISHSCAVLITPAMDPALEATMRAQLSEKFGSITTDSIYSTSPPIADFTLVDVLPPHQSIEEIFASWGPPVMKPFIIEIPAKLPEPPFFPKETHRERSHPKQPFYAKFHKNPKRNHRNKKH